MAPVAISTLCGMNVVLDLAEGLTSVMMDPVAISTLCVVYTM